MRAVRDNGPYLVSIIILKSFSYLIFILILIRGLRATISIDVPL